MAQYLLSVPIDESGGAPEPENVQRMYKQVGVFNDEIMRDGQFVFAGGLHPSSTATTVRYKDGETFLTDGPYAETKEQLGGVWIIEAKDLDDALAIAKRAASSCEGSVEVRPFNIFE
jgi:hypothetical protein